MEKRALQGPVSFLSYFLIAALALAFSGLWAPPPTALANQDQSYDTLRNWIEHARPETELTPGQHLTLKDRAILEPLIPQPAWEYYFYDGMDMEIAETGTYPPPADWGKNVPSGYQLDEQGVLIGFSGGGFPFPNIDAAAPQVAQQVIWNMLWRPGAEDYVMPMVAWSRSPNGQLDRQFEFTAVTSVMPRGTTAWCRAMKKCEPSN